MSQPLILEKHDGFYVLPMFALFGARALFTTRRYDMAFDRGGRPAAFKKAGIEAGALICPCQVHGDAVALVTERDRGRGALDRATALRETDALITAARRVPIAVLTADCLPVLFFSPTHKVAAAVHAGWRGVQKQIIVKAVRRMGDAFGVVPSDMIAVLGPAIRSCCYEVGAEFRETFPECVSARSGKAFFDIAGAAVRQMTGAGVKPDRIYDSRLCTSCAAEEFFSHRREGATAGRSMAVVEIL